MYHGLRQQCQLSPLMHRVVGCGLPWEMVSRLEGPPRNYLKAFLKGMIRFMAFKILLTVTMCGKVQESGSSEGGIAIRVWLPWVGVEAVARWR